MIPFKFRLDLWYQNTLLSCGIICVIVSFSHFDTYWSLIDAHMQIDRHLDKKKHYDGIYGASIASHGKNHSVACWQYVECIEPGVEG